MIWEKRMCESAKSAAQTVFAVQTAHFKRRFKGCSEFRFDISLKGRLSERHFNQSARLA